MTADLVEDSRRALLAALGDFETSKNIPYGSRKIIHDTVWGTCTYEPWEATLLELPAFQRLRGIKQTGFAYLTYPAAEHSRFQHFLGVAAASSKIFDCLKENGSSLPSRFDEQSESKRWRMLLRIAALVHDLGHSVFSHTSERLYGLCEPFPELTRTLTSSSGKRPGSAEIVVYLLVTSEQWYEAVTDAWTRSTTVVPPSRAEWERIGRWVMGQEDDPELKFLADIISGPIDADKLDYVFRDGYTAGIPVGYDLERLVSTICVDPQRSSIDGTEWYRLTLPIRGINALEQLVMGRLVLNSYLYHHQKCRAAESAFERAIAREYLASRTLLGRADVWSLFSLQDADLFAFGASGRSSAALAVQDLLNRRLRVRVAEFRLRDLADHDSEATSRGFEELRALGVPRNWDQYEELTAFEDEMARAAGLDEGTIVLDVPSGPSYADLENLLLPGRGGLREMPVDVLNYRDWIAAYRVHRSWIRIFSPRGDDAEDRAWASAQNILAGRGLKLPDVVRIHRS